MLAQRLCNVQRRWENIPPILRSVHPPPASRSPPAVARVSLGCTDSADFVSDGWEQETKVLTRLTPRKKRKKKSTSYHWWFHLSPYAAHVRPRPRFPARQDVASVLNLIVKAGGSGPVLHPPASSGQTPCRLRWCCRWVSLWYERDTRDSMRISLNDCTNAHLCWRSLKSSDLDTSDDFSEELDRSHGFFTASGEGGHGARDILIHGCALTKTMFFYLLSSADLGHRSRPAQQRNTASHTSSSLSSPTRSHTLRLPGPLTSSGFSDAFRLRIISMSS